MNRRRFIASAATLAAGTGLPTASALMPDEKKTTDVKGVPTENAKLKPPESGLVRVAVVISQGVNVIDFSGPWGVFDSAAAE